jgi:hypothetical protein
VIVEICGGAAKGTLFSRTVLEKLMNGDPGEEGLTGEDAIRAQVGGG